MSQGMGILGDIYHSWATSEARDEQTKGNVAEGDVNQKSNVAQGTFDKNILLWTRKGAESLKNGEIASLGGRLLPRKVLFEHSRPMTSSTLGGYNGSQALKVGKNSNPANTPFRPQIFKASFGDDDGRSKQELIAKGELEDPIFQLEWWKRAECFKNRSEPI
uniref:Uncharacterized protein n=1 Tax=Coccidioides posadasii RMSCC 3488 TaxID=454284 RepID=A0A0J6F1A6_COCPO|nr:hypothetical protein CPAG_02969 [Coccidioides posadasii RMSCC 3488]